jgi:DNA-binding NtrC family response regulator
MSVRSRPRPRAGNLGSLVALARDLTRRVQGKVSRRPVRVVAPRPKLMRGRPPRMPVGGAALAGIADRVLGMKLPNAMEAVEIALLFQAMADTQGNITAASRLLGIHRKAVERLLVKHKVERRGKPRHRHQAGRSVR